MMSVKSLFLKLNHDRTSRKANSIPGRSDPWLTEDKLVVGTEKFLKLNGYPKIEYGHIFNQGGYQFTSPIVGHRNLSQNYLNEIVYHEQDNNHTRGDDKDAKLIVGEQKVSGMFEGGGTGKTISTVCIVNPKIQDYDLGFFGHLESVLYDIIDNYENTNLILVSDSFSYLGFTTKEEISVTMENLMGDGLHLLFMNEKFDYAFFEKYEDIIEKPITVYGI